MNIYELLIGLAIILAFDTILKVEKAIKYIDLLPILLFTLIGARLLFILHSLEEIENGSINPFDISNGGLAFYGGLAGLFLSLWIVSRYRKINFLKLTDVFLVFVPLIQAVGRWGNYFNNELYGKPTILPWAIEIPLEKRLPGYELYSKFHPLFLYESILNLFNFLLLNKYSKKRLPQGIITSLYLIIYGIIRILLNQLRIYREYLFNIEASDIFSIISILIGLTLLFKINMSVKKH